MKEGLLLAFSAAVVHGFLGIAFEVAGKRRYNVWDVIFVKQFTGLCIGLAYAVFLHLPLLDWRLFGLGFIGAVAYVAGLAAYLTASREKSIAVNWTILDLSVVVPILLSVVWLGDAFALLKITGVACTVLSILLIGGGSGPSGRRAAKGKFPLADMHCHRVSPQRRFGDTFSLYSRANGNFVYRVFLRNQFSSCDGLQVAGGPHLEAYKGPDRGQHTQRGHALVRNDVNYRSIGAGGPNQQRDRRDRLSDHEWLGHSGRRHSGSDPIEAALEPQGNDRRGYRSCCVGVPVSSLAIR